MDYVMIIPDLDKFIGVYVQRKTKKGSNYWDYEKEGSRSEKSPFNYFSPEPYYRKGEGIINNSLIAKF